MCCIEPGGAWVRVLVSASDTAPAEVSVMLPATHMHVTLPRRLSLSNHMSVELQTIIVE